MIFPPNYIARACVRNLESVPAVPTVPAWESRCELPSLNSQFLILPPYQRFLVLREETSSYRLLAGTFHAFAGMIFLIIRTVAVEIIDRLYVVHRPMGILLPVVAGIRLCITQTTLFVITSRR